jgi:putative endonuclease
MRFKDALGRHGEDVAVAYLVDAGLTIIARNWRCADGELDIIAQDGAALVFCEKKIS